MGLIALFLIALALSFDSFAVSIATGLNQAKNWKESTRIALYLSIAQSIMPFFGWIIGGSVSKYIVNYDHWVAFVLLSIIGGQMVYESLFGDDNEDCGKCISTKALLFLSLATSIDALIVGVSFAFLELNILLACSMIFVVTFAISFFGNYFGNAVGRRCGKYSELFGGFVLFFIGLKILLEHLQIY